MAKQNTLQDVKDRMKEMQDSKAAQLETIRHKQAKARNQIEAAALAMKQAMEEMDVDGYAEAKARKRKAQTALDMYNGRYAQIQQKEYISEAESDKVIDSLLGYEDELADNFKTAVSVPLKQLAKLYKEYMEAVQDTERTLDAWQRNIHANYRSMGAMVRTDPLTGEKTDRSKTPYPVHQLPFTGCSEAEQLGNYLEKAAALTVDT